MTKIKVPEAPPPTGETRKSGSTFWDITYYLGPDLVILILFSLIFAVAMFAYGGKFTFVQSSIILPLLFLIGLVAVAFASRVRRIFTGDRVQRAEFFRLSLAMVRDWFPLIIIVFIYENGHDLTDLIRPDTLDAGLRRIDETIFGIEPTLALQSITTPWFTEYMTFAYALYFFFPVIILGRTYARGEFFKFREFGLALSLCFYLGLTGYMTVPAIGPRYFMSGEFTVPLDGIWLTERAAAAWNRLQSVKRDCFPSLHTALTTISLIYFWRYRRVWPWGRALLWTLTPLIVSLWFSTVYLRYHWIIDVFAGWALAIFCCHAAPWIVRAYYRKKTGSAPELSIQAAAAAAGR